MADQSDQSDQSESSVMNPILPPADSGWTYGDLVPLARRIGPNGQPIGWPVPAIPTMAREAINDLGIAATAPGNALEGKISPEQMPEVANRMAMGMAMAGGFGEIPENALASFGGRQANGAELGKLNRAMMMAQNGASNEAIHATTGWWMGPDQQWRFGISDAGASIKSNAIDLSTGKLKQLVPGTTLGDILDHPELFKAYPHLKKIPIYPEESGYSGGYQPAKAGRSAELSIAPSEGDVLSTLLHETQHAIQDHEGFAFGGSPSDFLDGYKYQQLRALHDYYKGTISDLSPRIKEMGVDPEAVMDMIKRGDPKVDELLQEGPLSNFINNAQTQLDLGNQLRRAERAYNNLAGEVESRTVETQLARRDWSKMPHQYEGYVPTRQQIIRFRGQPARLEPVDHDPFARPGPKINAFSVQQEHEDEVRRIESEAYQRAARKRSGTRQDNESVPLMMDLESGEIVNANGVPQT